MRVGGYLIDPWLLVILGMAIGAVLFARSVLRGGSSVSAGMRFAVIAYSLTVVALTVLPETVGRPVFSLASNPYWRGSVNLVPLRTITAYARTLSAHWGDPTSQLAEIARQNLFGNLALLLPMGFMAPIVWRRLDGWARVFVVALTSSVLIEAVQFAWTFVFGRPGRSVDIDDVILNVVGALVGYALYRLARAIVRRRRRGTAAA